MDRRPPNVDPNGAKQALDRYGEEAGLVGA